jgi:uncharacterized protein (UPF0297 family)
MFGIEKDFQNLMEQVYGPLEEKQMTEIDISKVLIEGDTATIMGVKYKRVETPQSFNDKLSELLEIEIGDDTPCVVITDMVMDLIRENIPECKKGMGLPEYCVGYNDAIKAVNGRLFGDD